MNPRLRREVAEALLRSRTRLWVRSNEGKPSYAFLVASSLAWVEVARAVRVRDDAPFGDVGDQVDSEPTGVAEHPIAPEVAGLARRIGPSALRSLDAPHLAAVLLLDSDVLVTYDDRPAAACRQVGMRAMSPAPE